MRRRRWPVWPVAGDCSFAKTSTARTPRRASFCCVVPKTAHLSGRLVAVPESAGDMLASEKLLSVGIEVVPVEPFSKKEFEKFLRLQSHCRTCVCECSKGFLNVALGGRRRRRPEGTVAWREKTLWRSRCGWLGDQAKRSRPQLDCAFIRAARADTAIDARGAAVPEIAAAEFTVASTEAPCNKLTGSRAFKRTSLEEEARGRASARQIHSSSIINYDTYFAKVRAPKDVPHSRSER